MENGTPNGETAPQGQVSNDTPVPSTTVTPVDDSAELKKQLEQAQLRARQLENEKAKRDKADDEARQKQLEEEQRYKELYEQSEAARKRLEDDREAATRQAEIKAVQDSTLSEYAQSVKDIAATAGLQLLDDSETAKADYKKRLDAIAEKIGVAPAPKVPGNNGLEPEVSSDRDKLVQRMRFQGAGRAVADEARRAVINDLDAVKEMKRAAGLSVE